MAICPKCNTEFEANRTTGKKKYVAKFCSRFCANGRSWSPEKRERLRQTAFKRNAALTDYQRANIFLTPARLAALERAQEGSRLEHERRMTETPFDELPPGTRRKRVMFEQDGKCNRCDLDEWLGEPLTLELEHKDGDRDNNARENLECLCPNCHSLTPTWRGRNNTGKTDMTKSISVEGFPSITAYLKSKGLAPKGAAFARVRRKLTSGELKS